MLSRRAMLKGTAGVVALGAAAALTSCAEEESAQAVERTRGAAGSSIGETGGSPGDPSTDRLFGMLDEKIQHAMEKYAIPGVAVGVFSNGQQHVRGYGITSVDAPDAIDEHTLFRIGSTTKTFTGVSLMHLVEAGRIDLDATVRTYLPEFAVADLQASSEVTVRQLLNHSAGWFGDDLQDFGRGEDALRRYVSSMAPLAQLTPLGSEFFYNNSAVAVAGRIVEEVQGSTYEKAVQDLVLDPLRLDHTRFFTDEVVGFSIAGCHTLSPNGKAILDPTLWYLPRSLNPTGGLISSVRDQLAYLRFLLGDGSGAGGTRILTPASMQAMRSRPGPGGTLLVELDGMGVTLQLRPSAEGVRIVQHGGDLPGQRSGFLFVPEKGFAFTLLTNSDTGAQLVTELFVDDWALSRFAGIHNIPAEPQALPSDRLASYEGRYTSDEIDFTGHSDSSTVELTAEHGGLQMRYLDPAGIPIDPMPGATASLRFYRDDYVLLMNSEGAPIGWRANFVRGPDGNVAALLLAGRRRHKES